MERAGRSDGVHFSFEKQDHVTATTICGAFEEASISERATHRHELVSFALDDATLEAARTHVSRLSAECESEEEAAISAAMAAAAAAAAQAEAEQLQRQQRSDALYTALSEKRTAGKARESAKKHAASASESERE